jgi:ABC-type amino acid transport substrate-binding protein
MQTARQWTMVLVILGLLVTGAARGAAHAQETVTPDDWAKVQAAGKIVFGTSGGYPPFESYNSNFQLDGFDIALANEIGKRLGVEVAFNDFAFAGLFDALQLGQFDAAISAISVTPDRQAVVDFTNLYYIGEDAVLVREDGPEAIRSATDFSGLKVGVERGTTYQAWAQQSLVETGIISQTDLMAYVDTIDLIRDLRNGEVDAAPMALLTAQINGARFEDLRVTGQGLNRQRYAIAARKGSTLIDPFNEALLDIQTDGTFAQLVNQYLNVNPSTVAPSESEAAVVNTPPVTPTVITTATTEAPAPTVRGGPAQICIDGMAYVADLNLDDQNMTAPPVMQPGQAFVKSWRVRNSGNCAWAPDYALVYVNGNRPEAQMGGQPVLAGRQVQPGETVDLSVSLVAPQSYGVFQAFWQMRNSIGQLFGEVIWVGIQVPDPNPPPTPLPPPGPTPIPPPPALNPNLRADSTYITAGQCTTVRWDVDNVNAVYFIDGSNVQGVGGHDSRTVCPTTTTTYTLRVVQRDNSAVDFYITINVSGAPPPSPGPVINQFSVSANNITVGQCVVFNWGTSNASGVNLYRAHNRIVSGGSPNGSYQDCPSEGYFEYKLEAYGNGNTSQTVSVQVSGSSSGGRPRDE